MCFKSWIEIAMLAPMGAGLVGVFINRIHLRKGIGIRVIQFLAVLFVLPIAVILGLEGKLGSDATATILGAVLGYVLSPIGKEESSD